jgi:cell wall-associated NlpC family hydrolase
MTHLTSTRERIGRAVLVTALSAFAATAHAQPEKPFAELSNSALTLRDSVVAIARAQVGKRYRMGGTNPERGFDCSGLVKFVLESIRVEAPRTAMEQSRIGEAIPRDTARLLAGDVLLFGKPASGVSHVGIYIGNGRYVHASSVAGRVIESPIERPPSPLIKIFKSARRVFGSDTVAVATVVAAKGH